MSVVFPDWLDTAWQHLAGTCRQGRMPHAVLLTGQGGVGKRRLADRLAASLLCERPDASGNPCEQCTACTWLQAGNHPDLNAVIPDEPGKAIKVDQVRVLCAELGLTSHAGRYKLAIIAPADAMNANAANSLLKTLEEPTDNTLLMLISASPGRLPATVRSRCHRVHIHTPDRESALNWLEMHGGVDRVMADRCLQIAGGAPFIAAELAESGGLELHDRRLTELVAIFQGQLDPLRAAGDWSGEHLATTLRWWQMWLQALIRWRQTGQGPGEAQMAQLLQPISEKVDCKQVFGLCDRVALALNDLGSGMNRQLLVEDLLIDWASLTGRPLRPFTATGR